MKKLFALLIILSAGIFSLRTNFARIAAFATSPTGSTVTAFMVTALVLGAGMLLMAGVATLLQMRKRRKM